MTPKISYSNIFYILAILVLAILLWWQSCGKSHGIDPQVAKMQKESDAKYNKLLDHAKAIEDSVKDLKGEKELIKDELAEKGKNLEIMFKENEKLRRIHEAIKPVQQDSGIWCATKEYFDNCDSCFLLNKKMEDTIKSVKKKYNTLGIADSRLIEMQANEIKIYKVAIADSKSNYDDLLNKYAKLGKEKASLSGGIEYNYSPAVSEVGAYLLFRTRKGSEVGAGIGGNTLSSWYFSIRAGQKIF